MACESRIPAVRVIAERVFSSTLDPIEGDDEPILDQTGNQIYDNEGRKIHTDE